MGEHTSAARRRRAAGAGAGLGPVELGCASSDRGCAWMAAIPATGRAVCRAGRGWRSVRRAPAWGQRPKTAVSRLERLLHPLGQKVVGWASRCSRWEGSDCSARSRATSASAWALAFSASASWPRPHAGWGSAGGARP